MISRLIVTIALLCGASTAAAQMSAELRWADTQYRFLDVSFTRKDNIVLDAFYVGVPGSNELNLGGGYVLKHGALTLTPLAYFVAGKEGGQRGVKIALLASGEKNGWKLLAFGGDYLRISGDTTTYQVLDTADLTRTIATRWELGVQAGFFHSGGAWNSQIGPVVKRNDARGTWAVSYRFGAQTEFRVGRVFVFQ